jgi:hypothetical protein
MTSTIRHAAFISLVTVVAAGCGKHPVGPSGASGMPLSEHVDTASYVFRYAAGDTVNAAWQEAFRTWAVAALDVQVPQRVTYNKYVSRSHMGDLTGRYNTNGYAEPASFTIHTIWPIDNHEVIHVYSALFGSPVALFNEGFAVAHQTDPVRGDLTPKWSGTPLHDWARQFRARGTLIPIGSLLATDGFRRFDDTTTYPEAGSFVRYLIDTYGLASMKRFFGGGNAADSAESVRAQFRAVYGLEVDAAERDWWTMLDAR